MYFPPTLGRESVGTRGTRGSSAHAGGRRSGAYLVDEHGGPTSKAADAARIKNNVVRGLGAARGGRMDLHGWSWY